MVSVAEKRSHYSTPNGEKAAIADALNNLCGYAKSPLSREARQYLEFLNMEFWQCALAGNEGRAAYFYKMRSQLIRQHSIDGGAVEQADRRLLEKFLQMAMSQTDWSLEECRFQMRSLLAIPTLISSAKLSQSR